MHGLRPEAHAVLGGQRLELQPEDLGATIRFVAELPPRACINQLIISPTWNRMYVGGLETPRN